MQKRFYEKVEISKSDNGFFILLDGRILKTPDKKNLLLASKAHAEIIAQEWQRQGQDILPQTMPCTRLINVAISQTPIRRDDLVAGFVKYIGTDLLCYRANTPQDLLARQEKHWQKYLDWAKNKHGMYFNVTGGIKAIAQPKETIVKAKKYAAVLDDIAITLLLHFTASYGSAVLAMAVMDRYVDAKTAFDISMLDETYQNELWGEDKDAAVRADFVREELGQLERLI